MRIITLIILCVTCAQLKAQVSSFNKVVPFDSVNLGFAFNVFQIDSGYVLGGGYYRLDSNQQSMFFLKTDSTGNPSMYEMYVPESDTETLFSNYGSSMIADDSGNYYMAATHITYSPVLQDYSETTGMLMKLNDKTGKVWQIEHDNDSLMRYIFICRSSDKFLYLIGQQWLLNVSGSYKVLIVKTDLAGNIIWRKVFGDSLSTIDRVWYSVATPDSGILVGVGSRIPQQGNAEFGNFYKLSEGGAIEWIRTNRPNGEFNKAADVYFCTKDNGYFIGYFENYATFNPSMDTSSFIFYKTDNELNPIWSLYLQVDSGYDFYRDVFRAYENADSSIMLCGQVNYSNNGWVRKMSKDGVQQWDGVYRPHNFNPTDRFFYLADIKQTDDGGWICTGTAFDSILRQSVWILKLDSNGCVENTCPQIIWDDVTYFLPDVTPSIKVYPNPANNYLQIEVEHLASGLGGAFYMYDLAGRRMLEQLLDSTTQVINISQVPPGMYVWQFTDRTGMVIGTGKIVVE